MYIQEPLNLHTSYIIALELLSKLAYGAFCMSMVCPKGCRHVCDLVMRVSHRRQGPCHHLCGDLQDRGLLRNLRNKWGSLLDGALH